MRPCNENGQAVWGKNHTSMSRMAFPGLTNKLLSRGAERVFVAFEMQKNILEQKRNL